MENIFFQFIDKFLKAEKVEYLNIIMLNLKCDLPYFM